MMYIDKISQCGLAYREQKIVWLLERQQFETIRRETEVKNV